MNHFYQSIKDESYFSFEDIYRRMVQRFESGSVFVEIGVLHGKSLAFLGVEIVNSGKSIELHAVDSFRWNDEQLAKFVHNLEPVKNILTIHAGLSHEVANHFADKSVDFLFIDADHSYECVKRDIEAWLPKMRSGSVISGHDFDIDSFPGTCQAVEEAFGKRRIQLSYRHVWEVVVL